MARRKKPDYNPPKDYKYRSGNEGRHHRGLIHPGYRRTEQPIPFVRFDPELKQRKDQAAKEDAK